MARLVFASLVTFGLLIGMVIGLVLAAMVASGEVNLTLAISLTVVINLVIWLISPWLSDLTLRWFNQLEFLDAAAVRERYRGVTSSSMRSPTPIVSRRHGSVSSPTATRPPSPMACCGPMRGSWSPRGFRVPQRGGTARRRGA